MASAKAAPLGLESSEEAFVYKAPEAAARDVKNWRRVGWLIFKRGRAWFRKNG
jgi:hypothetical protein